MNEKKDNSGFDAADITALSHLYRGEVYRSTVWRTRLDATTNWAVLNNRVGALAHLQQWGSLAASFGPRRVARRRLSRDRGQAIPIFRFLSHPCAYSRSVFLRADPVRARCPSG